jgi:hypothetical protein
MPQFMGHLRVESYGCLCSVWMECAKSAFRCDTPSPERMHRVSACRPERTAFACRARTGGNPRRALRVCDVRPKCSPEPTYRSAVRTATARCCPRNLEKPRCPRANRRRALCITGFHARLCTSVTLLAIDFVFSRAEEPRRWSATRRGSGTTPRRSSRLRPFDGLVGS